MTLHKFSGNEIKMVEKNCKNFEFENAEAETGTELATSPKSEPSPVVEPGSAQPFPSRLLRELAPEN